MIDNGISGILMLLVINDFYCCVDIFHTAATFNNSADTTAAYRMFLLLALYVSAARYYC